MKRRDGESKERNEEKLACLASSSESDESEDYEPKRIWAFITAF
jgi:hypothetical protein